MKNLKLNRNFLILNLLNDALSTISLQLAKGLTSDTVLLKRNLSAITPQHTKNNDFLDIQPSSKHSQQEASFRNTEETSTIDTLITNEGINLTTLKSTSYYIDLENSSPRTAALTEKIDIPHHELKTMIISQLAQTMHKIIFGQLYKWNKDPALQRVYTPSSVDYESDVRSKKHHTITTLHRLCF